MKPNVINLAFVVLLFITSCTSIKTTASKEQTVNSKVQSKDFIISVKSANPMGGTIINLSYGYDLRIKNDSAFAYLPYYGVAYSAPYNNEGGIKFAEPMKEYSNTKNEKLTRWDIRFKVRDKSEGYDFYVNIFENGSSTITVNSMNRQQIIFYGELKN
jgi:hypothetical protein